MPESVHSEPGFIVDAAPRRYEAGGFETRWVDVFNEFDNETRALIGVISYLFPYSIPLKLLESYESSSEQEDSPFRKLCSDKAKYAIFPCMLDQH